MMTHTVPVPNTVPHRTYWRKLLAAFAMKQTMIAITWFTKKTDGQ
jgi:hypothetical protein